MKISERRFGEALVEARIADEYLKEAVRQRDAGDAFMATMALENGLYSQRSADVKLIDAAEWEHAGK